MSGSPSRTRNLVVHTSPGGGGSSNSASAVSSAASTSATTSASAAPSTSSTLEPPFVVKALFGFSSTDPSALTFEGGDVIEVITMLESGWWDGMLGEQRGWFPSNYVQVINADELEGADREAPLPQSSPRQRYRAGGGRRSMGANSVLGIDDALGAGEWGNGGNEALEDLARSMGVGADDLRAGGGSAGVEDEFATAARRHQVRRVSLGEPVSPVVNGRAGPSGSGRETSTPANRHGGHDSFSSLGSGGSSGFGEDLREAARQRREREGTAGTIRAGKPGNASAGGRVRMESTPRPQGRARDSMGSAQSGDPGAGGENGADDAWIPCLTPDGQVYYHNTLTGADSWELPISTPEDDAPYGAEELDYFPSPSSTNPPSSTFPSHPSIPDNGGFRAPPKSTADIPFPWVSRLSDDGRQWFYVNKQTGEISHDLPKSSPGDIVDLGEGFNEMNLGGTVPPPARRQSVEVRRRAVQEWKKQIRQAVQSSLRSSATDPQPMAALLDIVNDTLRDVFEAAVAGSAAEEEASRASDLHSAAGLSAALAREESATEMLVLAHQAVLAAISDLLRSFGYTGPIDRVDDMERPAWTGDMTLIGSIGAFSANIHAATRSKKVPESKLPIWQEVTRSASRLRDVVGNFPLQAGSAGSGGSVDQMGRSLTAWLGLDDVGELCRGRWGFTGEARRPLNQDVVGEAEHIQREFDAAMEGYDGGEQGSELEMLRIADRFKAAIWGVDIAAVIDIDTEDDHGVAANEIREELRKYYDLVNQARTALRDLDSSVVDIDRLGAEFYLSLQSRDPAPTLTSLQRLGEAITATQRSLSNLLIITSEQSALVTQDHTIHHHIGRSSPRLATLQTTRRRPISTVSAASRASQTSRASVLESKRGKVRGIEDDFQESEDLASERIDLSNPDLPGSAAGMAKGKRRIGSGVDEVTGTSSPTSDGASAASLARAGSGKRRDVSATSSTTSLAYQRTESDSSSVKGPRTSFLKTIIGGGSRSRSSGGMAGGRDSMITEEDGKKKKKATKNLAKLLGEDVMWSVPPGPASSTERTPPSASYPTVPAPPLSGSLQLQPVQETPFYLAEDYAPDEIVFDDKGGVKAGTLKALVDRLTPHGSTDTSFFQAFMLTFRSFTTGDQLLDVLFERYHLTPSADLLPEQMADWVKLKQTPIRLRIANVLRAWLDVHFMVAQDMEILDRIEHFASVTMLEGNSDMLTMLSKTLLNLVARRRRGEDPNQRRIVSGGMLSPPAPLVPRVSGKSLQLTDISPLELARQLTIIEFQNFQKIKPAECLHKAWTAEDDSQAPNVRAVIHTANKLAAWVGLLVLQPRDAKSRATLMKYFIQAAIELRNMNNFSSMAGITAGLNAAPVDRLKRTKEHLSNKTLLMKEDLDRTMDSSKNFANYKDTLKTINPPCVPFLGFYLSALTFIEDGNKDFINPGQLPRGMTPSASASSLASAASGTVISPPSTTPSSSIPPPLAASTASVSGPNGATPAPSTTPKEPLINFFKRFLSAEILRDIQQYQSQPYNLAKCRPVHEFLVAGLERVEQSGDLYERSLLLEPREREEERM